MGDPAEPTKLAFESCLRELETIVQALEGGQLPLEIALRRYEEGIARLKSCMLILDEAERRIEILARSAAGEELARPFPFEASDPRARRRPDGPPEEPEPE
jgi:exodeoxyribonuclease VII small subunit